MKRSMPMRSLPSGEISGERAKGVIFVGTMSITPSGSGVGLPLLQHVNLCAARRW